MNKNAPMMLSFLDDISIKIVAPKKYKMGATIGDIKQALCIFLLLMFCQHNAAIHWRQKVE